jgi:hypothetical protein
VPDLKPPRSPDWTEAEAVLALLQFQRESVVRKVEGLTDEQARKRLVDSDTTLLWLLRHLDRAERMWVLQRFAGGDPGPLDDTVTDADTVADAIGAYRATWERVDTTVAGIDLGQPAAAPGADGPTSLRWVLLHLLEETARHAGHADILRELIDGSTGR